MARILTLTNWYPPHHFGGYEILCDNVMTRLHQRGHEVEVLCSDETVPHADDSWHHPFRVNRDLTMYWRDGAPWTPSFPRQLAIERANQRELERVLDRFNPDVVSVWHMGALSLSLLSTVARREIPMVYGICDDWLIYGVDLDPWSRRWYKSSLRRAAGKIAEPLLGVPTVVDDLGPTGHVCFISEFTMETTRVASSWSFPSASVVYPGIDLLRFPITPSQELKPWKWRLLFMGRLDPRKGTDTLLQAMTQLPKETTLSLLGRGEASEQARLEALAAELGIADRLHFEGIDRHQLAEAYRSHDCVVFPSEWSEAFGMVPLEAMACGTPVVATGVGGSAEYLVDETNCLLFAPADADALADAVIRMGRDSDLRENVRQHGFRSATEFDVERTTDVYEERHIAAAKSRGERG